MMSGRAGVGFAVHDVHHANDSTLLVLVGQFDAVATLEFCNAIFAQVSLVVAT